MTFLGLIDGAAVQQDSFIHFGGNLRNLLRLDPVLADQIVEQLDRRVLAGVHREPFHRRMVDREVFIVGTEILDDRLHVT